MATPLTIFVCSFVKFNCYPPFFDIVIVSIFLGYNDNVARLVFYHIDVVCLALYFGCLFLLRFLYFGILLYIMLEKL